MRYLNGLCFIILGYLLSDIYGQQENKFFRSDYKYIESTAGFYKIHTLHKTWKDAKRICALEGASLFYPENKKEAEEVTKLMNDTTPFNWVFIGVSDMMSKGVYDSIDGVSITNIYHNWVPGQPSGLNPQNCAVLRHDALMNDEDCYSQYPFICKKSLYTLQWNLFCNIPNMDYEYYEEVDKCYKFHLKPLTWTQAYAACSAEQSYLAIIDSQVEADRLANITARAPKDDVEGDYLRGAVHLGFRNNDDGGWQTIRGTALADSGYPKWSYAQPDGGSKENCGSMFYNGELNDIGCEQRMFFICEHDIDVSNAVFDTRMRNFV